MNKRFWIGVVAVFLTTQIIEGLVNLYLLGPVYDASPQIWRPITETKLWIFPLSGVVFSFFFVFFFSKGYEAKGLLEGARYGLYVALFVALPASCGNYAMMQIHSSLALQWLTFSAIEYVIAGVILSGVFLLQFDAATTTS